jgi:hypothetical protein
MVFLYYEHNNKEMTMKNTRKLPFETITELKAPWIKEIKSIVTEYIAKLANQYKEETEYCGVPEFHNEKFLYERFKENCDTEMWNGNWEVLKYFALNFEIKVFKTMIGEWTFTDADKEMYEYFNNVQVNDKTKCKSAQLAIKSGAKITTKDIIYNPNSKYEIYYEFTPKSEYDANVITVSYFEMFGKSLSCIENMIRNCKMLAKFNDEDFFTSETLYVSQRYEAMVKCDERGEPINVSCKKIAMELDKPKNKVDNDVNVMKQFSDFCMENKKYKNLYDEMMKMSKELFKEFANTSEDYKNLSEKSKENIARAYGING